MTRVETDPKSGFCGGVIRAISTAENHLSKGVETLYSLGEIVHNEEELHRLASMGLKCISAEELGSVPAGPLIIRAHGEAPQVYDKLNSLGFEIIDCTCPVVLKLQNDIREAWERVRPKGGRIVIFGKIGHPEVLGLVGQTDGEAAVVEGPEGARRLFESEDFNPKAPVELFSQTTMSPEGYVELQGIMESHCPFLKVHDTICSQVASRHRILSDFAAAHSAIVFVSGGSSSNGKVLSQLCRSINPDTHIISSPEEIDAEWFKGKASVGVCGATSTPKWLLEKVEKEIRELICSGK